MAIDVKNDPPKCKVYKRRWLMLFLYVLCSIVSYMHFIYYSIIADAIVEFYGVSYEAVNWTAMSILLVFIPCIFPGIYLINKVGVRKSLLIVALATAIGSWVKVGGVAQDRFWVYMLGQIIVGAFQVIICALPVPVAATWFAENEVSTACGIGFFGLQLGFAVGAVIPPMIVKNSGIMEDLEFQLYILNGAVALACTVVFAITALIYEDEPPEPPSPAKAKSKDMGQIDFLPSFKRVIKNRSYITLITAYGFNLGVFVCLSTLLNQIILKYYPDAAEDVGRISLIILISGMIGAIIFGLIMDKFHKFKETTFGVFFGCFGSILIFAFTLPYGLPLLYGLSVLIGFFTTGLLPVGYEVAVELTYPEPDCIPSGLVQMIGQIFGIAFIYLYSYMFYNVGVLASNLTLSGFLLISSIMVLFIRFDMKRREAQTEKTSEPPSLYIVSGNNVP